MKNRARFRRLVLHGLNGWFLFQSVLTLVTVWEKLPESIPVHFGLEGTPDRYTGKGVEVFLLLLAPWLISLLMYGLMGFLAFLKRIPWWINLPGREAMLLGPEERAIILPFILEMITATTATVNFLLYSIGRGMLAVAFDQAPSLPAWSVWPGLVLVLAVSLVYTFILWTISKRLFERADDQRA